MALPRALSPGGCWPLPPAFRRPPPPECRDACACLQTGCDGRARAGRRFRAEGSRFNPQREHARAGFRHALQNHPQIRIDMQVDPGRWRRPPRAGAAWQAFRQHLPLASAPGTCTQLRELHQGTFPPQPETGDTPPAAPSTRRCSRPGPRPGNPLGTNRSWACACRRRTGCRIPTATGSTSNSVNSRCAPRPRRRVLGRMNPTC